MEHTSLKIKEQFITDKQGNTKVHLELDVDEYQKIKKLLEQSNSEQLEKDITTVNFKSLRGLALKAPENPDAAFKTEKDLWKNDL